MGIYTQWLGPNTLSRFDKNKLSTSAHKINVKRLDDYHFTPDVIKIDVQGLEDSVARGGCETINKHKPVLIVEAPSDDFVEMMAEFKLRPYRYNAGKFYENDRSGTNVMFISDDRMVKFK